MPLFRNVNWQPASGKYCGHTAFQCDSHHRGHTHLNGSSHRCEPPFESSYGGIGKLWGRRISKTL